MIIKITTDRLPNKFPKDAEYEVGVLAPGTPLHALVEQGEAHIVVEEPVKTQEVVEPTVEEPQDVVEEPKVSERDEIKQELKLKGIEFKGNAKTDDLKALLINA